MDSLRQGINVLFGLCVSPRPPAEQHENGKDLQTTDDHAGGQHDLAHAGEGREVACRTDHVKTGTDVAHAGQRGREAGGKGEVIQRHRQRGGKRDQEIAADEQNNTVQGVFWHDLAVQFNH